MYYHEFGKEHSKIIILIHGLTMTWDMFENVIDILKKDYHVIAVAVAGHDREENDDFSSVEEVSNRIEDFLYQNHYDDIACLYGLSMGGGIAIRMLANDRIHYQIAIIDAGITPYQMPYLLTRFILIYDFCTTMLARTFPSLLGFMFPEDRFSKEMRDKEILGIKHLSAKTIWRAYDSTDNYSMPKTFPNIDTYIEYWYGQDEKKDRRLDIEYVKTVIPNIAIKEIESMTHGQFVCSRPKEFCERLIEVVER